MPTPSRRDEIVDRILRIRAAGFENPAYTAPAPTPACLDAEQLAAWADSALPANEIEAADEHLAGCGYCQSVLAAFERIAPALAPAPVTAPFWRRPLVRWAVPLAASAAAVLVVWTLARRTEPRAASTLASANQPILVPVPDAPKPVLLPKAEAAPPSADVAPKPAAVQPPPPAPLPSPPAAAPPPQASRPMAVPERQAVAGGVAGGVTTSMAMSAKAAPAVVGEFAPPETPANEATRTATAAGGGGGRGGGLGLRSMAFAVTYRWRVLASGDVERSPINSAAWTPVDLNPPAFILGGAAPGGAVCWLVGRAGVVLLSLDGLRFDRLPFPEQVDLVAISAFDARRATVRTSDGRIFSTVDGGQTWKQGG